MRFCIGLKSIKFCLVPLALILLATQAFSLNRYRESHGKLINSYGLFDALAKHQQRPSFRTFRKIKSLTPERHLINYVGPHRQHVLTWVPLDLELVKWFVSCGANVNFLDGHYSPLTRQTKIKNPMMRRAVISYLLNHGASPNLPLPDGYTPFYYIVATGDLELVKLSLLHGARLDTIHSKSKVKPIDWAKGSVYQYLTRSH